MSKKGEIVIPKKIREEAKFALGASAGIVLENGVIHIHPHRETAAEIMARWEARAKEWNLNLDDIDIDALIDEDSDEEVNVPRR